MRKRDRTEMEEPEFKEAMQLIPPTLWGSRLLILEVYRAGKRAAERKRKEKRRGKEA